MTTNLPAVKTKNDLVNWLNKVSQPLDVDKKFIKSALIAISERKELFDMMQTPAGQASIYHSLEYAASTGLSLNPQEGKAALIPYNGKIQYQIMKNGIIELAMQTGKIKWLRAETVFENDIFEPPLNPDDKPTFKPARKNRGEQNGFFAECKLTDGSTHFKYMTVDQIEEHRNKYSKMFNAKPELSPWKNSFEGMALKTVIKALFRNVYISPEISKAVGIDDENENMINLTPGFSADDLNQKLSEPKPEEKPAVVAEKKTAPVSKGDLF